MSQISLTKVTVLPHPDTCPNGLELEIKPGKVLCDALLNAGVEIEHACDGVSACSTCHIIIREGYKSLNAASDEEEDQLDKAWGLTPTSRLACQVKVGQTPLIVELPRYSLNHAREHE
ncbi:MAG: ISC system 2Fe-2S type ferredoxin [Methylotenera sp.]|uniref:ISC system 2Fe-2S type ferredoxin n=1 Tax=Methylotenera sp. TaxID=2051956 RepID=UPI0024875B14|nr:ISC system 2Fe-2S type ferredoxin [Methylotenera sp.]MDI1310440.1 ISC system 2Fe-2S type ferredoxin [Methylotenera sp.]